MKYVATIALHIDTQRDGRRAAEFILEDVVRTAKGWLGVRRVESKLVEEPAEAPGDAKPADPV